MRGEERVKINAPAPIAGLDSSPDMRVGGAGTIAEASQLDEASKHRHLPRTKIPALVRHSSSVNGLILCPNFELSGSMKM